MERSTPNRRTNHQQKHLARAVRIVEARFTIVRVFTLLKLLIAKFGFEVSKIQYKGAQTKDDGGVWGWLDM